MPAAWSGLRVKTPRTGPPGKVCANVPKVQGPVPEASLEVDTSRAKRPRGELGHGDATLDPQGGDRSLERRVEPGDAGERPGQPGAAGDRGQAGFPASPSEHGEPRRGRAQIAGQLGLMALPPEPHAPHGHIPSVDRALGADPLDALAHRGRLEPEALGCRGKGERVRLRPAIGVEPADLDRPPSIRILVQDAALPDPHHGEPRRHRADGDGVGRDGDRQVAVPRCGGGHLDPRKGHGDHELPTPEALGPDADVAVFEPEEGPLLPGLAPRDGDPGDSEGNRPETEGHGLDASRAPQGRDQRALELGTDQFWPAKPEENPCRRDARSEEQDERRKPDETPPDETTPRRVQPGPAAWVHVSDAPGSINASLEESRGTAGVEYRKGLDPTRDQSVDLPEDPWGQDLRPSQPAVIMSARRGTSQGSALHASAATCHQVSVRTALMVGG